MYADQTVVAIVPARGGSTRVPRKNIRLIAGKPLIAHTLDVIARVPEIDFCIVSTDDPEIAAIGRSRGAQIVDRPANLSTSEARVEPALLHALDTVRAQHGRTFDVLALLEPTSPLRRPETVSRCIRRLIDGGGESLLTARRTRDNLGRMEDGKFRPLFPNQPRRQQEREPLYIEAGVVYACRIDKLRASGTVASDNWLVEPVSDEEAVDINEEIDFLIAQTLLSQREAKS